MKCAPFLDGILPRLLATTFSARLSRILRTAWNPHHNQARQSRGNSMLYNLPMVLNVAAKQHKGKNRGMVS